MVISKILAIAFIYSPPRTSFLALLLDHATIHSSHATALPSMSPTCQVIALAGAGEGRYVCEELLACRDFSAIILTRPVRDLLSLSIHPKGPNLAN